jgi:hypothetical protein
VADASSRPSRVRSRAEAPRTDNREYEHELVLQGEEPPRSPRSALRFGFHGRKVLTEHVVYWSRGDLLDPQNARAMHTLYRTPVEIDLVLLAYRNIATEVEPATRRKFIKTLDSLKDYCDRLHVAWGKGIRAAIPLRVDDPQFEPLRRDFIRLADRALTRDSPLRPFYDAGAAIGDFQYRVLKTAAATADSELGPELPEIEPLVCGLRRLPAAVVQRCKAATVVPRSLGGSKGPEADKVLRVLLPHFDIHEDKPRSFWSRFEDQDFLQTRLGQIYVSMEFLFKDLSNSTMGIEFESIAPQEAERPRVPSWDPVTGILICGDETVTIATQATNLRPVLNRFEESGWQNSVGNPLVKKNEQAIYQVQKLLKAKTSRIEFSVCEGGKSIGWRWADD